MKVPFFDLKRQYTAIKEEINDSINATLESQRFIMGELVEEFEESVAKYCNSKHAISVASGTDALLLSVKGHNISGDVLTSTFTFFATAGAIHNAHANPQFVDIKPETFNIDPEKIRKTLKNDNGTIKAILPVHLFGKPAEMNEIMEIAEDHDLDIIEDAAQSIGAEYNKKKIGSLGTTCFSFFPSKNLGGFGDGGLITTNDDEIAERIKTLRVHGAKPKYYHHTIGYNSRLDVIQAAVLNVKLKYLDKWIQNRIKNADIYSKSLKSIEKLELPQVSNNEKHSFNQYTIKVKEGLRDKLKTFLESKGIGTALYYPLPLHMQPCFSSLNCKEENLLNAELVSSEVFSLPVFPELEKEEIEYIIENIFEFFENN